MQKQPFRKAAVLLLAALLSAALTGCGDREAPVPMQTPQPESALPDAPVTAENAKEETAGSGFAFIHNGVRIEVDADAASLLPALGQPDSTFEAASCVFEGEDKMYSFRGFELDTYPTDGKDYVSAVVLRDDSVATAEGVTIGDSVQTLRQVYGEPDASSANLMVYEAGDMQLRFILENDAVVSVEYLSKAIMNG